MSHALSWASPTTYTPAAFLEQMASSLEHLAEFEAGLVAQVCPGRADERDPGPRERTLEPAAW